ncbi:MAG: hypothetical protein CMO61_07955 [Verrucomicrobiales bacterium]|jgi:hypothetical protein|nr:hypothetical protein [Verrucomicrobiales bacterium]|tara:strand:+ start:5505 stop:6095 length:591 start_codon:yes stop_codon:yes gene_type:complete
MNSPATLRVDLQRNRRVIIHAPVNVVQKKNEKPLTRIQKLKIDLAITTLLPYFSRWVEKQEKLVLLDGRPLSEWETMWATEVGVKRPDMVRILPVPHVPTPGSSFTGLLGNLFGFLSEGPNGMAVSYGIYLEAARATNPSLLVHELTHVAQFERLGGIEPYLREYLTQCIRDGYWDAELEHEARNAAAPFTRPPGG